MKHDPKRGNGLRHVLFAVLLLNGLVLGLTLLSAPTSRLPARRLTSSAEYLIGEMGKDAETDEALRLMVAAQVKQIEKTYTASMLELETMSTKLGLLGFGNLAIFFGLYIAVRKQTSNHHPTAAGPPEW